MQAAEAGQAGRAERAERAEQTGLGAQTGAVAAAAGLALQEVQAGRVAR